MYATPSTRATLARWTALPLRLIVGGGFMVHGYLKLGRGVGVFAAALAGLHIPAPDFMAWCTVVIEMLAGAAVFCGAFVSLMSVPMSIVLLVAIVKVHWQFGFSSIKFLAVTADGLQFGKPGVECDLLYLAALAALYLAGPDPWSFDHWRRRAAAPWSPPAIGRGTPPIAVERTAPLLPNTRGIARQPWRATRFD
jgi:putative oxidoreductase